MLGNGDFKVALRKGEPNSIPNKEPRRKRMSRNGFINAIKTVIALCQK